MNGFPGCRAGSSSGSELVRIDPGPALVECDYFTHEKGYPPDLTENGIATRDMVWMDCDLS